MKKLKVFFLGKRLKDIYPHATWFQVFKWRTIRFFRKVLWASFIAGMIVGAYKMGTHSVGVETYAAQKIVEVPVRGAVLDRIAGCESEGNPLSKGSHYDKNGQVRIGVNNNGTTDVGKYQINTVWHKKAHELGLDLTKEADNEKMATWIYENRGTEDWYPSKKCWQK